MVIRSGPRLHQFGNIHGRLLYPVFVAACTHMPDGPRPPRGPSSSLIVGLILGWMTTAVRTTPTTLEEVLAYSFGNCYFPDSLECTCEDHMWIHTDGVSSPLTGTIPSALSACSLLKELCVVVVLLLVAGPHPDPPSRPPPATSALPPLKNCALLSSHCPPHSRPRSLFVGRGEDTRCGARRHARRLAAAAAAVRATRFAIFAPHSFRFCA